MGGMGGAVIQHPQIEWRQPELFRSDGVHLSPQATDVFLLTYSRDYASFCNGAVEPSSRGLCGGRQ